MAVFVDLGEEENDPPKDRLPEWKSRIVAINATAAPAANGGGSIGSSDGDQSQTGDGGNTTGKQREEAHELAVRENPNRNSTTQALGCYP